LLPTCQTDGVSSSCFLLYPQQLNALIVSDESRRLALEPVIQVQSNASNWGARWSHTRGPYPTARKPTVNAPSALDDLLIHGVSRKVFPLSPSSRDRPKISDGLQDPTAREEVLAMCSGREEDVVTKYREIRGLRSYRSAICSPSRFCILIFLP
jgi:hypothetical protein